MNFPSRCVELRMCVCGFPLINSMISHLFISLESGDHNEVCSSHRTTARNWYIAEHIRVILDSKLRSGGPRWISVCVGRSKGRFPIVSCVG